MPKKKKGTPSTPTVASAPNSPVPSPQGSSHVENIQNVLRKGKMDPQQETTNKAILRTFLEGLTQVMKKEDRHFVLLFQRMYYTGSYYENLRISDANEFDINLVLKLPFNTEIREIEFIHGVKSFVKYKLNTHAKNNAILEQHQEIIKTFFEGEYLIPSKVRTWMQSVVDRALRSYRPPPDVLKVIPSASGPAKTIFLKTNRGYQIDIDLVPVIQFSHPEWPKDARKDMLQTFQVPHDKQFWFMVPKDFQPDGKVNVIDVRRLWRIHFPEVEKKVIHDQGCVKPLIKLLKALRTNEGWVILASYYLKTIVLWMVEKNPKNEYWRNDKIWERLLEALKSLKDCVSHKMIKYYFYPAYNLISKIGNPQAEIISNRLDRIIRDIEANPAKLETYFKF